MVILGDGWLCPTCPMCGAPPVALVSTTQAACGTDDCAVWLWNPRATAAHNLSDQGRVQVESHPLERRDDHTVEDMAATLDYPDHRDDHHAPGYCTCGEWAGSCPVRPRKYTP
jgi:hypothetical protein